jgi:antitoxin ParD1/3/4
MPSPSARSVSLTPELTRYVAAQVASGRYRTASEVVRAALRLLQRSEPLAGAAAEEGQAEMPQRVTRCPRAP